MFDEWALRISWTNAALAIERTTKGPVSMRGVVILARQRTGTNFLRSFVSRSSNLADLGEVFHTETLHGRGNYFAFRGAETTIPILRNNAWSMNEVTEYFDYLERSFPIPMIDVKYNSVFSLATNWQSPVERPVLIAEAFRRGYAIVHLIRTDLLAHVASQVVAKTTGTYIVKSAGSPDGQGNSLSDFGLDTEIKIDPAAAHTMIRRYKFEYRIIDYYLSGYKNRLEVTYEELCEMSHNDRQEFVRTLCARYTTGTYTAGPEAETRKLISDWKLAVSNHAELQTKLGHIRLTD